MGEPAGRCKHRPLRVPLVGGVCHEKVRCNSFLSCLFAHRLRFRPGGQCGGYPRADGNARTYGRADPGADGHAVPDACADDGGVR